MEAELISRGRGAQNRQIVGTHKIDSESGVLGHQCHAVWGMRTCETAETPRRRDSGGDDPERISHGGQETVRECGVKRSGYGYQDVDRKSAELIVAESPASGARPAARRFCVMGSTVNQLFGFGQ